jgi:Tol biopolymer transport system component
MPQRVTATILSLFVIAACSGTNDSELQALSERIETLEVVIESTTSTVTASISVSPTTTSSTSTESEPVKDLPVPTSGNGFNILFSSGSNVFVMDSDGTNIQQLSEGSEYEFSVGWLAWSPDGTKIAFHSDRGLNNNPDLEYQLWVNIFVMDSDGTNIQQLSDTGGDVGPTWSPDGTKIAFHSDRDGFNNIYVMNQDGSSIQQLTHNDGDDSFADWSPDGQKIAFNSDRDGFDNIYIMNQDGSSIQQLTHNNECGSINADWSPNGQKIAYSLLPIIGEYPCEMGGLFSNIALIDTNGSSFQQLTDNDDHDYAHQWSPDGTQIIFSSDRWGENEIFSFDLSSSTVVSLGVKGSVSDTR